MNRKKSFALGFALLDTLIAAVLVAVAALGIAQLITKSKTATTTSSGSSVCLQRSQWVVDAFKNVGQPPISNWHSENGFPVPSPPAGTHRERFIYPIANPSPGNSLTYDATNGWELMDNGANWALALYNTGHFCVSAPPYLNSQKLNPATPPVTAIMPNGWGVGTNKLYPPGSPLLSESIYLNIQRFDFNTNSKDCLYFQTLRMTPLGMANSSPPPNDFSLGSKTGLFLTAAVQYTDANGLPAQCFATQILRADGDMAPPSIISPPGDLLSGPCPGANCFCKPGGICMENPITSTLLTPPPILASCGQIVTVSNAVNEPGVVMGCELDFSATFLGLPTVPTGNFFPCTSFSPLAGITGTILKSHSDTIPNDNITGIQVQLSGLVTGYYVLFINAFDSAQNPSAVANVRFYNKLACPLPAPIPSGICDCAHSVGGPPWVSSCQAAACSNGTVTTWPDIPNGTCGANNCCCRCPLNKPESCP